MNMKISEQIQKLLEMRFDSIRFSKFQVSARVLAAAQRERQIYFAGGKVNDRAKLFEKFLLNREEKQSKRWIEEDDVLPV
jgi:hypothetical protein